VLAWMPQEMRIRPFSKATARATTTSTLCVKLHVAH
jgi:hypothetical protein